MSQPKFDKGKVRAAMPLQYFPDALVNVARVCEFGAVKYRENSYREIDDAIKRYTDALVRHTFAWMVDPDGVDIDMQPDEDGNLVDVGSGLPHISHMVWNALAVLQLTVERSLENDDDYDASPCDVEP